MSVTWLKQTDGTLYASLPGPHIFTAADLEAGLRVLREKPVFKGGSGNVFQKRDGAVCFRNETRREWCPVNDAHPLVRDWSWLSLRAIADALES